MQVFQKELLKEKNTVQSAARSASEKAKSCGLCAVCNMCAEKFYEVLQGKKDIRPLPVELKDYFSENSQFYYYLSAYKMVRAYRRIDNTLICLKGFSSTTPAIYSATFEDTCSGGGLYLNVEGFGVVIDPCIGFVDSMHKQGIFIEDIDAVVVTHNHLDHNADVGTISALHHDINQYYERQVKFYKNFFSGVNKRKHEIVWLLDEGTKEVNAETISESTLLSQCVDWRTLSDEISLIATNTDHMRVGRSYAVKLKISLDNKDVVVGYTSDTKFFPKLVDFMADADILIFNISDIYEKDVKGVKQKSSHLGYDGSIKLLQGKNQCYRLAIASEFCCSNGDYRMKVVRKLNEQVRAKRAAYIIPGEIGLKVDLKSQGIYCSHCKHIVPFEEVSIVSPKREFGLFQYVCKKCQLYIK